MKTKDVEIGRIYVVKVSGALAQVRLDTVHPHGGWFGTNTKTGRQIRILTAAKLRSVVLTAAEKEQRQSEARQAAPFVEAALRGSLVGQDRRFSGAKRGAIFLMS